jgi:hypothetical protein
VYTMKRSYLYLNFHHSLAKLIYFGTGNEINNNLREEYHLLGYDAVW